MLEKMHSKENTALTTSGDVEMKEKIIEESNITATPAISQTSSISPTSSITSVVADIHQADDSESTTPSVIDCASSSQSFTDSLTLCQSLTVSGSVSHDAEDTVTPMEIDQDCVVQDVEQNAVDSDSSGRNEPIESVTFTHIYIDTGSVGSTPNVSESVSSTQSVTEVGHSVTDPFSSRTEAVEEASVVPLGVTLTDSFSSNGSAVDDASVVPLVNASVDGLNANDSAVETDDSFQEEMVIDTKDIKQEVDSEVEGSKQDVDSECEDIKQELLYSDCEDSVGNQILDDHVLDHLRGIFLKGELDSSSNSSCSHKTCFGESDASKRKRLFNSLSQSFPGSALSRVLHSMDTMPIDSEDEEFVPSAERLSSSCFGSICLDKEDDDDLTCLSWLQKSDLLKDINADLDTINEEQKENAERQKNGDSGGGNFVPQSHPSHVPYNPQKHVNSKPPYSFSCLIFMAVEDSPGKKLPVKDIYNWILTNFPYFQNAPGGWKNSVRHNLSLNKCFKKVEKDKGANIGKGSLWCIDPEHRPNLLQALRKTPYHPYQQLQMMSSMVPQQQVTHVQGLSSFRALPLTQRPVPNTVSPHLFPFLSRRLAQTNRDRDVANILLSMGSKNSSGMSSDASDASGPTCLGSRMKRKASGPPKRQGPFIITPYPVPEHSYSSPKILEEDTISGESSIDNEYDFGDDDDISDLSNYPSDWDEESGDEVDGDLPQPAPRKKARLDMNDDVMLQRGAQLLMSLSRYQPGASDNEADKKKLPEKSSPPCSKSLPRSSKFRRSSSASPFSRKSSSTAATKSSSLSSSLSSSASSSSSAKKPRAKPVSRSALKTKLFTKASAKSAAASKKSSSVSSKAAASSKTVRASGSKTATHESTSSASSKKSEVSKTPVHESSKKLNSAATPPSAKPATPKSAKPSRAASSTTKASIIMTRRGKAAAEEAAAKAAAEEAAAKAAAAAEEAAAAAAKAAAALETKLDASASVTKMDTSASGTKTNASVSQTKSEASVSQTKSSASVSQTKSSASVSQTKSSASGTVTAFHRMRTRGIKLHFS